MSVSWIYSEVFYQSQLSEIPVIVQVDDCGPKKSGQYIFSFDKFSDYNDSLVLATGVQAFSIRTKALIAKLQVPYYACAFNFKLHTNYLNLFNTLFRYRI